MYNILQSQITVIVMYNVLKITVIAMYNILKSQIIVIPMYNVLKTDYCDCHVYIMFYRHRLL